MKKLKLKALELGAKEVLSREQLKNVLGGFDDGSGSGKKGSGSGSGKRCGTCSIDKDNKIYIYPCKADTGVCTCPQESPTRNDC
jgi:hypothetical protein